MHFLLWPTRIRQRDLGVNQSLDFSQLHLNSNSDGFFAEALNLLTKRSGRPNNLADIQALGILTLYEADSDREAEMQKLADEFATAMTDLCLYEASSEPKGDSYERVRVDTYCGSLSLLRILRLSQAAKHQNSHARQRPPDYLEISIVRHFMDDSDSHQAGFQRTALKIFQLTEWIYVLRMQPASPNLSDTVATYIKCLEWYNDIFHDSTSHNHSHLIQFAQ